MADELSNFFRESILAHYGEQGETWFLNLPTLLDATLNAWKLELVEPLPNLRFSYLARVREGDQIRILKLAPAIKDQARAAEYLRLSKTWGSVALLREDASHGVHLLEEASPGDSAKTYFLRGDEKVVAEAAARWMARAARSHLGPKPEPSRLTPLATLGLGFEKYGRSFGEAGRIPLVTVEEARGDYFALLDSTVQSIPLHGDLHHENFLRSEREPWLAIDPKGYWGDPVFEVGAWIRNPIPEIVAESERVKILEERIEIFAHELQTSRERVRLWARCQAILAAIWSARENGEQTKQFVCIAQDLGAVGLN